MRTVLINPNRGNMPPLGLLYIAGVLEKENHEVEVIELPPYVDASGLKGASTDRPSYLTNFTKHFEFKFICIIPMIIKI